LQAAGDSQLGRSIAFTLHDGGARPLPANWRRLLGSMPEHVRDAYEERAALIEYDGGEKRKTAERRAFDCVWLQFGAALDRGESERAANAM
jgi:hypothetical protein